MTLTEGESKALLASTLLVVLAALGRVVLQVPPGEVEFAGMSPAGDVDSALAVAESIYADVQHRRKSLSSGERIDPNEASEAELDRLPGVGPSLARAIVLNRGRYGPFRTLTDLERVPGIGKSTVRRLEPYTTLPASPTSRGPPEAAARAGKPGVGRVGRSRPTTQRLGASLDLNRASVEELMGLPGIGARRANVIARWREEHGRFRSPEDLLKVPGIGPATLARLRPLIYIRP